MTTAHAHLLSIPAVARRPSRRARWIAAALLGPLTFGVLAVLASSGHRHVPSPAGCVCRVEAREVYDPWDRFEVFPRSGDAPGFAVFAREVDLFTTDGRERKHVAPAFTVYAYPSGRVLESHSGADAERAAQVERERIETARPKLDLDGDGQEDWVEIGTDPDPGLVRIAVERGGRVLFEDRDDIEYEPRERVIALGDLDGDGQGEFALLHPRSNRSAYDFELWDRLFGAKSWISIVSGSRLER